jgi:hypothetical protein
MSEFLILVVLWCTAPYNYNHINTSETDKCREKVAQCWESAPARASVIKECILKIKLVDQ